MEYLTYDTTFGKHLKGLPAYFMPWIDLSLLFIMTNSDRVARMFPNQLQRNIVASFAYVYYQHLITNKHCSDASNKDLHQSSLSQADPVDPVDSLSASSF